MESQLLLFFDLVFLILQIYFQEISVSPDKLYMYETRLVVKVYLDFLHFLFM